MKILEVKKNLIGVREIIFNKSVFSCQVGSGGVISFCRKKEGDKCTPMGEWLLKTIYYRPDRINLIKLFPNSELTFKKITKNCGWSDDHKSKCYNKYIEVIKNGVLHSYSYESLWREDQAYDICIEIDYNNNPVCSKKGSAIFLHCSFEDLRATSGCIAVFKKNLIQIISSMTEDTKIKIT